jgi:hypothetical protein
MLEVFDIGIKILIGSTSLFFLIWFSLCRAWANPKHPEHSTKIGMILGILYSFMFFLGGFIVVSLVYLSWDNLINLIKLFSF